MDYKTLLNSIGLIFTIIGIYIVLVNSPLNFNKIDGGDFNKTGEDNEISDRNTTRKNGFMRKGVYMVIFGTILQLISNYFRN